MLKLITRNYKVKQQEAQYNQSFDYSNRKVKSGIQTLQWTQKPKLYTEEWQENPNSNSYIN